MTKKLTILILLHGLVTSVATVATYILRSLTVTQELRDHGGELVFGGDALSPIVAILSAPIAILIGSLFSVVLFWVYRISATKRNVLTESHFTR